MRSIPAALQTHLNGQHTTISTCWRITNTFNSITTRYCFTDADKNLTITIAGVTDTYYASSGMLASSIGTDRSLNVDTMEAIAILQATMIDEDDLLAGKFDNATVDIFQVNREGLSMGVMWLAKGWGLGNLTKKGGVFHAELRSLCDRLNRNCTDVYSPSCRAVFGDSRCGLNLISLGYRTYCTVTGTPTYPRWTFQVTIGPPYGYPATDIFRYGYAQWTSGVNLGYKQQIKSYNPTTHVFELAEEAPYDIIAGAHFYAYYGCDHSLAMCEAFDNDVNFRGEPFVPGQGAVAYRTRYPDTRRLWTR